MRISGIDLKWLGHSGFLIKNSKVIYIDPYNIKDGLEKADLIFITHSHYDHCSVADIEKIIKEGTKIIMPADCQSKVTRFNIPIEIVIAESNHELEFGNARVNVLLAYNVDKSFHPKEEGWNGYLIKMDDILIYHAGDTDKISEMQKLTGFNKDGREFVALLPVGGRFTMNAEEAAEAASLIKPTLAVPMHFGGVAGSDDDAKEFLELCEEKGIKALIMEKE